MAWFGKSGEEKPTPLQPTQELSCSFCNKSQRHVVKLIAGPGVWICDGCVLLCRDIIEDNLPPDRKAAIPTPPPTMAELRAAFDASCVGLDLPKRTLLGALGMHLARLQEGAPALRPPLLLLVGPHGAGKSALLEALTELTTLPAHHADVNRISATGYVGLDVENLLWELVCSADRDFRLAEAGVLALDGLHRITTAAPPPGSVRDVGGTEVQRELLRVLEGRRTEVAGSTMRHPQQPAEPFWCHRLLIVLSAAFEDLPDGDAAQRSFLAERGLQRELLARIDQIVPVPAPDAEQIRAVLTDPSAGLLPKQLAALAAMGHSVQIDHGAIDALVEQACGSPEGAWALRHAMTRLAGAAIRAEGPLVVTASDVRGWAGAQPT